MLVLISPAKRLDFKNSTLPEDYTIPDFLDLSQKLVNHLKQFTASELMQLMDINADLAQENYQRYQNWSLPFTPSDTKQAILAFNGEVFNGLKAKTLSLDDLRYAQDHLRILSGLHGILRPLDLIKPYRLEMGTEIKVNHIKNLYEFWGDKIRGHVEAVLKSQKKPVLINLASQEYFKSVQSHVLKTRIITPVFKELRGDSYKIIIIYTKKARGLMTRFIIENRIENVNDIKLFEEEGYFYNQNLSTENEWVFTR